MKEVIPHRKPTRSKYIDYSRSGAYFVTICAKDRKQIFSRIVYESKAMEGAASYSPTSDFENVSSCATVHLTDIGRIAHEQLTKISERFEGVRVDEYVIMPNHIHVVIFLGNTDEMSDQKHDLNDIIRVYKSFTARLCKKAYGIEGLFQRSYYDHFIRDKSDYEKIARYIRNNPITWYYDELYTDL